jgi:hypothetical protein
MTAATDVLGGPVGNAPQPSKSVEVGGDDMHDGRGGVAAAVVVTGYYTMVEQGRFETWYSLALLLWASVGENQKETTPYWPMRDCRSQRRWTRRDARSWKREHQSN